MLWLCTFQMGLIIYMSLHLLIPKILSLPFDPQDNAFLSWAHSYAAFHNRSNCWVCRAPPSSSIDNQFILKEISPGISLEGLMLKLKLQYFSHVMRRVDSLEETLILGGIGGRRSEDDRGWNGWMASLTRWTWVWVNSGSWWWTGRPGVLWFMGLQRVAHDWATELNWTSPPGHLYLPRPSSLLHVTQRTFLGIPHCRETFLH